MSMATIATQSTQTIAEVVGAKLSRGLTPEERRLLKLLSPSGVAKLNADVVNGIEMERTLADFKSVYEKMRERHSSVQAMLSAEAKEALGRLGRAPSIDEVTLFASVPLPQILSELKKRTKQGEPFDSAVEELANEFKYQRLSADAAAFGETQSLPTRVNVLTPILRPSTPNALAPNMATIRKRKISVGLSPIVLWFKPEDSINVSVVDSEEEEGEGEIVVTLSLSGSPVRSSIGDGEESFQARTTSITNSPTRARPSSLTFATGSPTTSGSGPRQSSLKSVSIFEPQVCAPEPPSISEVPNTTAMPGASSPSMSVFSMLLRPTSTTLFKKKAKPALPKIIGSWSPTVSPASPPPPTASSDNDEAPASTSLFRRALTPPPPSSFSTPNVVDPLTPTPVPRSPIETKLQRKFLPALFKMIN